MSGGGSFERKAREGRLRGLKMALKKWEFAALKRALKKSALAPRADLGG
jgi:hypothetical protein